MAAPVGVGRVTASLTTLYNENSAALINNNFDFTLVTLKAPREYDRLGSTISRKRKVDAEKGGLHKTARRLGALFGEMLPPTDNLFRAYGLRVSEISEIPSINPREGSGKEGIFASHIGADTTSIWAAVTSGSAAIAVHLLGCMLARVFTGPEAISVWVELVQQQKKQIQTEQERRLYSVEHKEAESAAQQDISRTDLAKWDASARAWLQSADQAKAFHHKQTMLILNSASIPVNNEPNTYKSVMKAWVVALEAMNSLVCGIPQRVQDGAALLAISSWHLYPDMLIYGETCVEVKHKDPIFEHGALLTLGLQHVQDNCRSVYWSLPLAHLQYYGHPIQASRAVSEENSRITYEQFAFIILGCLFAGWRGYALTDEDGMDLLERLASILKLSTQNRFIHSHQPTWLIYVVCAARLYADLEELEKQEPRQLMKLGRRYSTFLNPAGKSPPPVFGLSQIPVLISVLKNDTERVRCLRQLCSHLKQDGSNFFIRYQASTEKAWIEYASVIPMRQVSTKRTADGNLKEPETVFEKHVRWLCLTDRGLWLVSKRESYFNDVDEAIKKLESLEEEERLEKQANEFNTQGRSFGFTVQSAEDRDRAAFIKELKEVIAIVQRRLSIEEQGELFLPVVELFQDHKHQYYTSGARDFGTSLLFTRSIDFVQASKDLLREIDDPHAKRAAIPQTFYVGNSALAALCSHNGLSIPKSVMPIAGPSFFQEFFADDKVHAQSILDYFENSDHMVQAEISCLRACAMMAEIYHLLPGATISTLVVKLSLGQAKWIPRRLEGGLDRTTGTLTLSQAFACIGMFESGACNLDPSTLGEAFAMASGNSLYIAGSLLCDPHEQPSQTEIRRVVGNIGRAGITFLISPPEVKTREPNPENWRIISHRSFDGLPENHFDQTSLHLSFTDYEHPLITEDTPRHTIDRAVILLETLVSVYEGGTWVGEVDILKGYNSHVTEIQRVANTTRCIKCIALSRQGHITYQEAFSNAPCLAATSIENWDELIEAPRTGAIAVRASQNWLARLAATAVCARLNFVPVILPSDFCWSCVADDIYSKQSKNRIALIF